MRQRIILTTRNTLTSKQWPLCLFVFGFFFQSAFAYDSGQNNYTIHVNEWTTAYNLMSFFVLPGQKVTIKVLQGQIPVKFTLQNKSTPSKALATQVMSWTAHEKPGIYTAELFPEGLASSKVIFFVMHPKNMMRKYKLNGYTIGRYPTKRYKNLPIYDPPSGFVEVTKSIEDMFISPHYRLKQFLCKQAEGYPKYLVLRTPLLNKLEFLTDQANRQGYLSNGFTIMSGYRTPYYNALIKNKRYSRHQWGGAADIYIDEKPKDGVIDDLNGDGLINVEDAKVLWDMVEQFYSHQKDYKPMIGGLGLYRANTAHGPFVHIDVRGFRARW